MVILSKQDKVEEVRTSSARRLYELLNGGVSHVRLRSRGNTPTSNESLLAAPALSLATITPSSNIGRVTVTEASTAPQRASASRVVQPTSGVVITEASDENGFDPSTFDPTNSTLYEVTKIFRTVKPGMHFKVMTDILLKYSLNLHGFPPCPEEDLMLAVYFFLEEMFGIQARMIACCRHEEYRYRGESEDRVGVLFDKIQVPEYILNRSYLAQGSGIKIKPNKSYSWIMAATARLPV